MNLVDGLVNQKSNLLNQLKLNLIPQHNIYARTMSTFHRLASRRNSSVRDAAMGFRMAEQRLIDNEEHYYDLEVLEKSTPMITVKDRRGDIHQVLDLVTNSYNDLEWVESSRQALIEFISSKPLSSCISRKISGNHSVHRELAEEVADFLGYDQCVLGTCGYISQISTVFSLFNEGDVIFSDQLNHSSLVDGISLSKARVFVYNHCDYDHLEELLARHRRWYNCAGIISDGVFSTKGATCNLDSIVGLAEKYNCLSLIDDTHGVTVAGSRGRGVLDMYNSRPDVVTGGFGKAFGSFGGFAVANEHLASVISVFGRQNVNTSHLSPIMAAQSLINLRHFRENQEQIRGELRHLITSFNQELSKYGIECYKDPEHYIHPIFCLYKATERETLECQKELISEGFLPSFFPPPVAPKPSLRFSFHRNVPVDQAIRLAGILGRMNLSSDPGSMG